MFTILLLTLAGDLIGPLEAEVSEERLTSAVTKVITDNPDIVAKAIESNPEAITKVIENNPEVVLKVLEDHPEIFDKFLENEKFLKKIEKKVLDTVPKKDNNNSETRPDALPPVPIEEVSPEFKGESSDNTVPEAKSDTYVFYLYTMEGCGPCKRMYDEFVQRQGELPGALYIGKSPVRFRDGSQVMSYPALEVVKNGKIIKRFVKYTPFDSVLESISQ